MTTIALPPGGPCTDCDPSSASVCSDLHKYHVACTCGGGGGMPQYASCDSGGSTMDLRAASAARTRKTDRPPALPPRPPPRNPAGSTRSEASVSAQTPGASSVGSRKYVWWCSVMGLTSCLLGALLLGAGLLLRTHTHSLHHLETIPTPVPALCLVLTGICVISLARRRNRYSYLIKVVGACCLICALICVLVTITTTVIHMNRLQTLRECVYTQNTRTCTCYSVLLDSQSSEEDEGVKCVFEAVSDCAAVHGALYRCLRAVFGLSVAGVLVCICSAMLAYQLLSHERKKMYWEQLELRCRSLYRPTGPGAAARAQHTPQPQSCGECCAECRAAAAASWDLQHRFWASGRIGNLYSPNPGTGRRVSPWSWFPWTRNSNQRVGGSSSGDSAYGFGNSPGGYWQLGPPPPYTPQHRYFHQHMNSTGGSPLHLPHGCPSHWQAPTGPPAEPLRLAETCTHRQRHQTGIPIEPFMEESVDIHQHSCQNHPHAVESVPEEVIPPQGEENRGFQCEKQSPQRQGRSGESELYFADVSSCCNISLKAVEYCGDLVGTIETQADTSSGESDGGPSGCQAFQGRHQRPRALPPRAGPNPATGNTPQHCKNNSNRCRSNIVRTAYYNTQKSPSSNPEDQGSNPCGSQDFCHGNIVRSSYYQKNRLENEAAKGLDERDGVCGNQEFCHNNLVRSSYYQKNRMDITPGKSDGDGEQCCGCQDFCQESCKANPMRASYYKPNKVREDCLQNVDESREGCSGDDVCPNMGMAHCRSNAVRNSYYLRNKADSKIMEENEEKREHSCQNFCQDPVCFGSNPCASGVQKKPSPSNLNNSRRKNIASDESLSDVSSSSVLNVGRMFRENSISEQSEVIESLKNADVNKLHANKVFQDINPDCGNLVCPQNESALEQSSISPMRRRNLQELMSNSNSQNQEEKIKTMLLCAELDEMLANEFENNCNSGIQMAEEQAWLQYGDANASGLLRKTIMDENLEYKQNLGQLRRRLDVLGGNVEQAMKEKQCFVDESLEHVVMEKNMEHTGGISPLRQKQNAYLEQNTSMSPFRRKQSLINEAMEQKFREKQRIIDDKMEQKKLRLNQSLTEPSTSMEHGRRQSSLDESRKHLEHEKVSPLRLKNMMDESQSEPNSLSFMRKDDNVGNKINLSQIVQHYSAGFCPINDNSDTEDMDQRITEGLPNALDGNFVGNRSGIVDASCLGPDLRYEPVESFERDNLQAALQHRELESVAMHVRCYSDSNTMDSGWQSGSDKHGNE